jgi:putative glycosyltransferase (TIGR04348 family)
VKIALITPARLAARTGNRNTAVRWARLLKELGHDVSVQVSWNGRPADLMIALHARRSHDSISRFASSYPSRPLVLALTGTDLYRDIRSDADAKRSLRLASRMIVLQEMGLDELTPDLRKITRVIYQSTRSIRRVPPLKSCFEVCISGHLREEKDPFRLAAALKYISPQSRIRVTHMGAAMSSEMAAAARGWMESEPRYLWSGDLPHHVALRRLARSRLMVISSRMEGGANVVTEALAARVPVIASRIPGNVGMLGKDYAGYYAFGNERALARLLWRAESDPEFYRKLKSQCEARRPLVSRKREKQGLKQLLAELASK